MRERGIMPGATVEMNRLRKMASDSSCKASASSRIISPLVAWLLLSGNQSASSACSYDAKSGTPAAKSIPVLVRVQAAEILV